MQWIIRKLKISQQLLLVVFALGIPLALFAGEFLLDLKASAENRKNQAEGAAYIQLIKPVQLGTAVHRGNVALLKNGDTSRQGEIDEAAAGVDSAYTALEAMEKSTQAFQSGSADLRTHWKRLRQDYMGLDAPESFAQHTLLINEILNLTESIASESGLAYAEDKDIYYSQRLSVEAIPDLVESLGVLRGRLSGLLQARLAGGEINKLLLANVHSMVRRIEIIVPRAEGYLKGALNDNPDLDAALSGKVSEVKQAAESLLRSVDSLENSLMAGEGALTAEMPAQFFAEATAVIGLANSTWDHLNQVIVKNTQQRASAEVKLYYTVAILLLGLFLAMAWFALTVIHALRQSLGAEPQELADVATAIAEGRLNEQMKDSVGAYAQLRIMRDTLKRQIQEAQDQLVITTRIQEAIETTTTSLMIADGDFNIVYVNPATYRALEKQESQIKKRVPDFDARALVGKNIDIFHRNPSHQREMLKNLREPYTARLELGEAHFGLTAGTIRSEKDEILGFVVEWRDETGQVLVESEVGALVDAAKAGDLSRRLDTANKSGFFKSLSEGLNTLLQSVDGVTDEVSQVMQKVASGDLKGRMDGHYQGKFGEIADAVNETLEKLGSVIRQVSDAGEATRASGHEISQGNRQLSERTEKQSSSLEETASALEQLTGNVRNTADNSRQADMLSAQTRDSAMKGGEVVERTVAAIQEISESSEKIAEIIGVIDEIAFQTNLLALNASVEAARAGDQGRGFAVVATEVRNLAQRSANSAREIKDLIQDSVRRVKLGSELAGESGVMLQEIIGNVKKVSDLISDIAAATEEQTSGIEEINKAIAELDDITQQNAALAEETASAAESAMENTELMAEAVGFFNIASGGRSTQAVGSLKTVTKPAKASLKPVATKSPGATTKSPAPPKAQPVAKPVKASSAPKGADLDDESEDDWEVF